MFGMIEDASAEALAELGPGVVAGFAGGLALVGLFALPLRQAIMRKLLHRSEPAPGAFLWEDLFATIGIFLLMSVFVLPVVGSYMVSGYWVPDEASLESLGQVGFLGQALQTTAAFLGPCLYVAWAAKRRVHGAQTLGVRALTAQRIPLGRGLAAFVSFVFGAPFFFGASLMTAAAFQFQGLEVPVQEVAVAIAEEIENAPWRVALFAVLVIPLLEEILFRGFLLELFRAKLGTAAGVAISSGLFAIAHGLAATPTIFVLAVVIAMVKLRTRSLWAAWLVHALNNGASMILQQAGTTP